MKNCLHLILSSALCLTFLSCANTSFWRQIGSFSEKQPTQLLFDSYGTLYISTWKSGIYQSTNQGRSWVPMNRVDDSKPSSVHYILGIHPSGRMFATDQQQIYWSDNRGKSWKKVEQNFYPSGFFGFSFDSEGRIFTAGSLYESTDLGMSWKSIDRGVEHLRNRFISVTDSDVLFAGGYIIDTLRSAACVYRSADHGVTWNPTTLGGGTVTSITAQPRAIVFVSIWGNGLWRSSDNGLSWEKIYYGPRQGDLRFGTIFSDASGVLYSGVSYTEGGDPYVPRSTFVESTNGGRTWTTKIEGVKYGWVQTLTQDPKGYLYILDMEGNIYRGKIGLKPQ